MSHPDVITLDSDEEAPISTGSRFPQDDLRESVVIKGEVVEPVLPAETWEALSESDTTCSAAAADP